MNSTDLNRISNELLSAYLDDSDAEILVAIALKHSIPVGGKIFNMAVERAIDWMDKSDCSAISEENRSRITQRGLKNISEKYGAELGKDFSKAADGGLLINDDLLQKIIADMSPEALAEFKKFGIKAVEQDPFKMLEISLGVPFFTSLEAIAKLRLITLSDANATSYLCCLFGGLQLKHNWISDEWVADFIVSVMDRDRFNRIVKAEVQADVESDVLVFDDLLSAMGRLERHYDDEIGMVISRSDVMALDKVFKGENMSLAELGEQLRRIEDKHKK